MGTPHSQYVLGPPPPAETMGEKVATLYRYWLRIAPGPGLLPGRQHFDPCDLPGSLWPHLWLLDVQRNPVRFRYRLVGGASAEAGGQGQVGRYVDEIELVGDAPFQFTERLQRMLETREPEYYRGPSLQRHLTRLATLERLSLPLARDGTMVDMILNATVYEFHPGFHRTSRALWN